VAALGSYLDAKSVGGRWLVRVEDLDRPREMPGAADAILRTLDAFGFEWDGEVLYQSSRTLAYADAVETLRSLRLAYPCACSRREIAARGAPGIDGPVYPGTCRTGLPPGKKARSLRLRTRSPRIVIRDRIQGELHQDLEREVGDFVLRRADGIYAYQLAVVVDDAHQGVTHVVRGADLMTSTPRQTYLYRSLASPVPTYAHLPLAVDRAGRKLSKSDAATPIDPANPISSLLRAWCFLGQHPFAERPTGLSELWTWARADWNTNRVPQKRVGTLPPG
jgi:glutamyl-Q tRNA(Asp) synthetase